jgi:cleavage stimulation factor subunit 3
MFAIEQSLLSMATHPDIHFEAVNYLQQMSVSMAEKCEATASRHYAEEAINMFERSIKSFMKNNMLMYFAYADYEEVSINFLLIFPIILLSFNALLLLSSIIIINKFGMFFKIIIFFFCDFVFFSQTNRVD